MSRRRRLVAAVAFLVGAACALVLLLPVLAAPVNADDRYWYLQAAPRSGGSYLGVVAWTWEGIPADSLSGRLAPLASLARRATGLLVVQLAVASAAPIVVWQAVTKLVLGIGSIAACLAFVRSMRWRAPDGALVRAGRGTLTAVALGTALLTAAGSQAHSQFRNGWTSYSVLTWGAVIVVLGGTALVLWSSRLVAEHPRRAVAPACLVLVIVAAALNLSYELNYLLVPAALLALLVVPVTSGAARRAGTRAKLITGAAFFGSFLVVFVVVRIYLARVCALNACYAGVEPQVGLGAVRTMGYNLVSAVPIASGDELRADLEMAGLGDSFPVRPGGISVLVGLLAAAALVSGWWAVTRAPQSAHCGPAGTGRHAEARLLAVAAGLAAAVGVGEAALMGLSVQAQELITEPGMPYRSTMITWMTLSLAAVLAIRALTLVAGRRVSAAAVVALAGLVGVTAAVVLPRNVAALQAYRIDPELQATERVQWEVILGDPAPAADDRRCAALVSMVESRTSRRSVAAVIAAAQESHEFVHDEPFCSRPPSANGAG